MRFAGRILPHRRDEGAANMALDEALLESVANDGSFAYVRTYEWSEPTLSLGYFQRLADAEAEARFRSIPIIRRATGGGALLHDREITYSVIIPADHPFARRAQEFYRVVHGAVGRVIEERGLEVARRGDKALAAAEGLTGQAPPRPDRPFLCFADRDPEDLVAGGVKIVGSAQRRRAGAVLQHGSVLLAKSGVTPELRGVADLTSVTDPEIATWSAPIVQAIIRALALLPEASEVPEAVRRRAVELEAANYANPGWTGRR